MLRGILFGMVKSIMHRLSNMSNFFLTLGMFLPKLVKDACRGGDK